jgi:HSP20 family protein
MLFLAVGADLSIFCTSRTGSPRGAWPGAAASYEGSTIRSSHGGIGMTDKNYGVDLGRIMDEAFRVAQEFTDTFGQRMAEGFPSAEEMRDHFRDKFRWHGHGDFYPHYLYPPMNIYLAKDQSLVFEIALAGFDENDIDLHFRGDYLVLSARAPEVTETEEGIQYFKRRLKLKGIDEQRYYVPEDRFDRDKVTARFRNGLLRVVIPSRRGAEGSEGIKVNIVNEDEGSEPDAGGAGTSGGRS